MRGGAAPLRLLRLVPASAPGSRTRRGGKGAAGPEPGISDSAQSRGLGLAEGPRAGGRASARAGGPPSPALAGAQPQGHVDGLWRKPAPGEGGESRLGPPLTGGATPAGGGSSPGLPSQLLREERGGGRVAGERRRSGCVR